MAQEIVNFDEDLGDIVFSAKINRLVRQDLRMGRMVGNNCGHLTFANQDGGVTEFHQLTPQYLVFFRFYYDPAKSPYDRLLIVGHFNTSGTANFWEYTINDGTSWNIIVGAPQNLALWGSGVHDGGEITVDLSSLTAPTWIGSRLRVNSPIGVVQAAIEQVSLNWGAGILYHSSFPPF